MKYSYDEKEKVLSLDAGKSLILSKNEFGIKLNDDIINTTDFKVHIVNHNITMNYANKFKGKITQSIKALKFIWK